MIPQKLIIEGFLCYQEAQEIDLSDLPLCMLAGPNGSGKSTVFDAITFALFGTHRGGGSNADDLINKKCDSAKVIYEFLLGGKLWQIYRIIRRGARGARTTGDVRQPAKDSANEWEVVPDTSSSAGLKAWVAANLVLSGESFTRSMLLRQGESDRLLTSDPRDRFQVLAGIADLEKYQELEASVKERHGHAERETDTLASQIAAIAQVSDDDLDQAGKDNQAAAALVAKTDEHIASLQELHVHANHWFELKGKVSEAQKNRDIAGKLIASAAQIEADHQQLILLGKVLPHLASVQERRQKIAKSQGRITELNRQRGQKQRELDAATSEARTAQENSHGLEELIPGLVAHIGGLGRKVADSRHALDAAEATEKHRKVLADATSRLAKITRDHPQPEAELIHARREAERLTALSAALATVERFIDSRKNGIDAAKRRADAEAALQTCSAEAEMLAAKRDAANRESALAEAAARQAQKHETEIQTLLKHAQRALAALDNADGMPQCPTCGQPLTESHLAGERQRRGEEVRRLCSERAAASTAWQAADSRLQQSRRESTSLATQQQALDASHQKQTATQSQAETEIARTKRECRRAYDSLNDDLRGRISPEPLEDWATTMWPTADDFDELMAEAKRRAAAETQAVKLDKICQEWRTLTTQAQTLRDTVAPHPAAASENLPALRAEHTRLEKEDADANKRLTEARESQTSAQQTLKRLAGQIKNLETQINQIGGKADVELAHQEGDRQVIDDCIAQLPADWQTRAANLTDDCLEDLKTQEQKLAQKRTAQAFADLSKARNELTGLEARIAELQNDVAKIPDPARQSPQAIAGELQQTRQARAAQELARQQAHSRQAHLQAARQQRKELEQSKRDADRRLRHLKVLCELLGKKRLQLYLVRQAERKIVECANGILYKLSSGGLRLQLRGDENGDATEQALDLVAIRQATAGAQPIAVAFLSGSERFRVAVSLALAIGQVAGNNRCGECVIIDEGFGSLDRQGQDVMIQELTQLQRIMKRIILVSHQESFADAFPHGYRFTLVEGQTRVKRMTG
ncbi:MAG TPA: SMC family ATPase [Tepidisphaeraceae bacterium]|jgi:exonuclease SbcC|nr:SMC family ATPase [Tepidisphaeraceae bacterium]